MEPEVKRRIERLRETLFRCLPPTERCEVGRRGDLGFLEAYIEALESDICLGCRHDAEIKRLRDACRFALENVFDNWYPARVFPDLPQPVEEQLSKMLRDEGAVSVSRARELLRKALDSG